ncbi:OLC1v1010332C1 [Oldenlandia corymbosa var. corymbosa]|uniref:OLC1v1010332C1 n=1 Tax=Oldenlandia corymbosa var. corymbosa TaxID=529605 RepID=A0AAV1DTK8_OLDCO|nr:OLC1v1010332C1 [Oldenlandia corymbosa var. corymbosa]
MENLPKCGANYAALTPVNFLKRAAMVYSAKTSIIYGQVRFTWRETYERCRRLASSLKSLNVVKNNVVSVLAPNIPATYEMHFAVPMAGAVLNTINTRLDAKTISTILKHSEAKIFFVDFQFVPIASEALRLLVSEPGVAMPLVIVIDDLGSPTGVRLGELEYEDLVRRGNPGYVPEEITDEWDPIALNYTSGTTSAPKGVVYSHRGAYLSTLSLILGWEMGTFPVYLWSLPMFHCNGWTFTWGIAARGGTNVCIRNTTAQEMYDAIGNHNVTHMCCAPIIFNILLDAKPHERRRLTNPVQILTGGAPPPSALLEKIEALGFHIVHAYGLTEATGPALDRSKDVIISGGENISSVEVESVIYKHPCVVEASVVAMPHPKWGESPCAFVTLAKNMDAAGVTQADIIAHCRQNLPAFMVPKKVEFMDELPKTSTGKIQKFHLRALAKTFVVEMDKDEKTSSQHQKSRQKVDNRTVRGGGSYNSEPHEQILALSRL